MRYSKLHYSLFSGYEKQSKTIYGKRYNDFYFISSHFLFVPLEKNPNIFSWDIQLFNIMLACCLYCKILEIFICIFFSNFHFSESINFGMRKKEYEYRVIFSKYGKGTKERVEGLTWKYIMLFKSTWTRFQMKILFLIFMYNIVSQHC